MKRITVKSVTHTISDTIEEFFDFAIMETQDDNIVVESGKTKIKITVKKIK